MKNRKSVYLLGTAIVLLFTEGRVWAGETITYSYDALGRLVAATSAGTVNNGLSVTSTYDPAGNRASYNVAGASGGAPPPPPSPPPPANNPPTPVADSGSQQRCTTQDYNVIGNDTDPDGDYPLTLVSVTGAGFSVVSSTTVEFTSTATTGAKVATYTVQDSRGATATSTLTVNVSGGVCE